MIKTHISFLSIGIVLSFQKFRFLDDFSFLWVGLYLFSLNLFLCGVVIMSWKKEMCMNNVLWLHGLNSLWFCFSVIVCWVSVWEKRHINLQEMGLNECFDCGCMVGIMVCRKSFAFSNLIRLVSWIGFEYMFVMHFLLYDYVCMQLPWRFSDTVFGSNRICSAGQHFVWRMSWIVRGSIVVEST